ncbi:GNAT family N-acetyltransferase [Hwanghaeella sp. LZ110]|uniref:GNAT family N-acetyltransferase n=1 Tax=Hwanghaeella sp. LZ110 TaxID=3402810 RepID=UPI003B672BD3
MSTIQLDWESPDEETWRHRITACGRSTAFQSWSWGSASMAVGDANGLRRAYILKNGRPVGLLQVFDQKRLGLFTLGQILRGPLFFHPVMPEDRIDALRAVQSHYSLSRLKRLSILPELPDGPATQVLLSDSGFHQVLPEYDTAWLDLKQPLDSLRARFRQNFRNQLRRAEDHDIRCAIEEDPRPLLALYDAHRASTGYSGPSGAMLSSLPTQDGLCLQAYAPDNHLLAGVFFVLHGVAATYQVGWTSPEGRACHVHNLLLWRALPALTDLGIRHLDLGGLDWNKAPGVAHFKTGLGGESFSLPGTFV